MVLPCTTAPGEALTLFPLLLRCPAPSSGRKVVCVVVVVLAQEALHKVDAETILWDFSSQCFLFPGRTELPAFR